MKYIVYLTTNIKSLVNGNNRIYIGVHLTIDPEIFDGYIGCGVYINLPSSYKFPKTPFLYAVKKYGVNAFKRQILYIYDTKEEAYKKEQELVTIDFIKQDYVYNACIGGNENWYLGRPIYLFDLLGNLIRKWDYAVEAYKFYNLPREKFNYAIFGKHPLVDCFWANTLVIDISEYSTKPWGEPKVTHLYSKNGKWLKEFISRKECAQYLSLSESTIINAIKRQSLLLELYYVSDKLVDLFIPKARKLYTLTTFYLYLNNKYIGEYVGKDIMPIIGEYSWSKFRDKLRNQSNWYKDFYISEIKIEESEIPDKQFGTKVDVYTKYGEFIETLKTVKEVKEKYGIPSSKIKNIQLGDRYYKNYIFKYHSNKSSK